MLGHAVRRHSVIDTARAQLCPGTTSAEETQRGHGDTAVRTLGTSPSGRVGLSIPLWRLRAFPGDPGDLCCAFPGPSLQQNPWAHRIYQVDTAKGLSPVSDPRLVKLGLCQAVPAVMSGSPWRACMPCCATHTHPHRSMSPPALLLAAQCQRGPLPPACRCSWMPQPLSHPSAPPFNPGPCVSRGTSGWQQQRRADTPVPAAPSRRDGRG